MDDKVINVAPPAEDNSQKVVPDADIEAVIAEKDAKIAKLTEDRDNYRKGLLAAKGKLPRDGSATNPDDLDEVIDAKVKEQLAATELFKTQQEKDDIIKRLAQKNKELTVALHSRNQVGTSSATGGGQSTTEIKLGKWTPEQEAALKKKGLDPDKVWENLQKTAQTPSK